MNAIEISDLRKNYKDFWLEISGLVLPSGCIMGLVGENGAGKSTTSRLILNTIARDGGTVTLLGRDNREDMHLMKEDIGVVFDEVGISEALTVKQVGNIMKYTFTQWDEEVYKDHLKRFSLSPKKRFGALSRGMKMKLGLAVALSHNSKLLILDEPTSGLDPLARDEINDILVEFTRDESHSVLISSHILSDLEKICDYIAFLHKGKLLLSEEKDLLKEQYGVVHLSKEDMSRIPRSAVVSMRQTVYGTDAVVRKHDIPRDIPTSPVDLEQLFISMAKEAV